MIWNLFLCESQISVNEQRDLHIRVLKEKEEEEEKRRKLLSFSRFLWTSETFVNVLQSQKQNANKDWINSARIDNGQQINLKDGENNHTFGNLRKYRIILITIAADTQKIKAITIDSSVWFELKLDNSHWDDHSFWHFGFVYAFMWMCHCFGVMILMISEWFISFHFIYVIMW